jgi:hypothetical protein
MTINNVTLTGTGLVVGDSIEGVTGRLGWSALRAQDLVHSPSPPTRHQPAVPDTAP